MNESLSARSARLIGHLVKTHGVDRLVRTLHSPGRPGVHNAEVYGNGGLRYCVSTASFIEWAIYMYGHYESDVTEFLCSVLRPGDTAIDIGANVGVHALPMAQAVGETGTVVAFEPFAEVRRRLETNVLLNNLANIVVRSEAVADKVGTARFRIPTSENRGVGHLADMGDAEVAVTALDELGLAAPRVIKIDTEGAEHRVIAGAKTLLATHRPYVVYESLAHLQDRCAPELIKLGYRVEPIAEPMKVALP